MKIVDYFPLELPSKVSPLVLTPKYKCKIG